MVMKKQTNKQKKGDNSVLASSLGNVNWEKEAFNNNGMYGVCIKGVLSRFRLRLCHECRNVGSWIQCLRIWCVIKLIKNIPISVLPWPIKHKEWNNRYSWNMYTCVTTEVSHFTFHVWWKNTLKSTILVLILSFSLQRSSATLFSQITNYRVSLKSIPNHAPYVNKE